MFFPVFQTPTELFVWAFVAHLAADWLFQTEWMVIHKVNLRYPAGYVHTAIYVLFMALVFPLPITALIGVTHLLVETRVLVRWWMRVVKRVAVAALALPQWRWASIRFFTSW